MKRAALLEPVEEPADRLDAARLDVDDDNQLARLVDVRDDAGDTHVVRQRGLELVEQPGPRERTPIDRVIGLPRLGSNFGAFWGGLLIGVVQQMSTLILPYQLQNTAIFVVFLLIIFLRPQGMFGRLSERT